MYLIEILHQTTTGGDQDFASGCCILSKFYIKPQQSPLAYCPPRGLYLIEILHQTTTLQKLLRKQAGLYLIEILHQTTTFLRRPVKSSSLYLIEILHQTTTPGSQCHYKSGLYLIEILHQTTTMSFTTLFVLRCILSKFYIKPQPHNCPV